MSQAVANAKQFGATTKSTANLKGLVGNKAAKNFVTPKIADKHGNDEKNPYVSPTTLRAQKKQYKKNVEDAKAGKFDKVTGSGTDEPGPTRIPTPTENNDVDIVENPSPTFVKSERVYEDIIDAEIVEPKAIDAPRRAIEPGRQWSNG
jgi:hypothetical protein